MQILAAEDDATTRRLVETLLRRWNYEPILCEDGATAWDVLRRPDGPSLALLDWQMPEMDGTEVCRRARAEITNRPLYVVLLTAKSGKQDVADGLTAGADDYLTKPFSPVELQARLRTGERVLKLEATLHDRVRELEAALSNVRQLEELLPICSYCKRVRDDGSYWHQVEHYIARHTGTQFSHGVCPDCYTKHVQPQIDALEQR